MHPQEIAEGIYGAIEEAGEEILAHKPITVSFVGGERCATAMRWLSDHGIPAYDDPARAISAIAALRQYARLQEAKAADSADSFEVDREKALAIINAARADGRDALTEVEAKQVFQAYGLDATTTLLARTEDEAVELAHQAGYPVVMKIVSDANIHGIAIQEMAPLGTEIILGSINDAAFGPTVMFGLGGIFVEVLKDVTFRVAPVSKAQGMKMQEEIRAAKILAGARGEAPRDREAMAETIAKYSQMIWDLRDEVKESDANPVMLYEQGKGLKVVDARIILKKK